MTDETWKSCRIGACQRHQMCMYTACRNMTPEPAKPAEAWLNDPASLDGGEPAKPAESPEARAIEAAARAMCDRVNGAGDYDANITQRRTGWVAQAQAGINAYLAATTARPTERGAVEAAIAAMGWTDPRMIEDGKRCLAGHQFATFGFGGECLLTSPQVEALRRCYDGARAALTPPVTVAATDQAGEVERLRAMSDRATPGPWAWEQCGEKEDVPVVGIAFPGDDPDCKAPYEGQFRDSDASRMTIAFDWQSCDGHPASANAAFAVAAVNYVRTALATRPATGRTMGGEVGSFVKMIAQLQWNYGDRGEHEWPVSVGDLVDGAKSVLALQNGGE